VDKQSCQSSGRCLEAAPEVFAWDTDRVAHALPQAPELPEARLVAIARDCPAMAIVLLDDAGSEVDPFDLP
jgi:ferredoxin